VGAIGHATISNPADAYSAGPGHTERSSVKEIGKGAIETQSCRPLQAVGGGAKKEMEVRCYTAGVDLSERRTERDRRQKG
jgi:hypothetical protein